MTTADTLILGIIDAGRQASPTEVQTIINHVMMAPFASYQSRVPLRIRQGLGSIGIACPPLMPNVEWHLLERIYLDRQWPLETTSARYVDDLHQTVAHPNVEVWTYRYFNRPYVGFLSPSHVQGLPGSELFLFVAYSPIFSTLTTGYQTAERQNVFGADCTNLIRHS